MGVFLGRGQNSGSSGILPTLEKYAKVSRKTITTKIRFEPWFNMHLKHHSVSRMKEHSLAVSLEGSPEFCPLCYNFIIFDFFQLDYVKYGK